MMIILSDLFYVYIKNSGIKERGILNIGIKNGDIKSTYQQTNTRLTTVRVASLVTIRNAYNFQFKIRF